MIEQSQFIALWKRAANINRWALQVNLTSNNDATHSFEVAVIAHMLGVIEKDVLGLDTDPNQLAVMALYHEASEVCGMGDINSAAKNLSPEVHSAIKKIEHMFELKMLEDLPVEVRSSYESLIVQEKETRNARLVKAADTISAMIEAEREKRLSNFDYEGIVEKERAKLKSLREEFESVAWFLDRFFYAINGTEV